MGQLSLLDLLEAESDSKELLDAISQFSDDESTHLLRKRLIVKTCHEAFGISRNGKQKPAEQVWKWILSKDSEMPFSFEKCCSEWGADPDKMLDALKYYKRKLLN